MDILPDKQNIDGVFSNTTYYIDFYQREYKWTAEPVQRLLDDIFYAFEEAYGKNREVEPREKLSLLSTLGTISTRTLQTLLMAACMSWMVSSVSRP